MTFQEQAATALPARTRCRIGLVLLSLTDADEAAALRLMLSSDRYRLRQVVEAIASETGASVDVGAVWRHRNSRCGCCTGNGR